MFRTSTLLSALLAFTLYAAPVAAQELPLDRGSALIESGDFDKALEVLLPEYARNPSAPVAYAVARAYESLRDDPMALRFYQAALQHRAGLDGEAKRRIQERLRGINARLKNRPKKATLTVRTRVMGTPQAVEGASVSLSGDPVGRTPLSGVLIKPGTYRLRVAHPSFDVWEKTVTLAMYDQVTLDVDLTDRPTDVLIHTEPAGAVARILTGPSAVGAECVTPCLLPLRSGDYAMSLSRDGAAPMQHAFTKVPGQILELRLTLGGAPPAVPPPGQGVLNLVVGPPGAEVRLDGVVQGSAPLPRPIFAGGGIHLLEVRLPGYTEYSARVQVVPGETTTVPVQLVAGGGAAPPPLWSPLPVPVTGDPSPRPVYQPPGFGEQPAKASSWEKPTGWSLIGVGLAAVVGGTSAAVAVPIANKRKIDLATRFKIDDPLAGTSEVYISGITRADAQALEDQAKTAQLAGYITAGFGAALVITGAVFVAIADDPDTTQAEAAPSPSVSFVPWFSPTLVGVGAHLDF